VDTVLSVKNALVGNLDVMRVLNVNDVLVVNLGLHNDNPNHKVHRENHDNRDREDHNNVLVLSSRRGLGK